MSYLVFIGMRFLTNTLSGTRLAVFTFAWKPCPRLRNVQVAFALVLHIHMLRSDGRGGLLHGEEVR